MGNQGVRGLSRTSKTVRNGQIPGSQVTVVRIMRTAGSPLFFVEMEICGFSGKSQEIGARYDIGKAIFIDHFDDQDTMYQLRRVELKVAELIAKTFRV